MAVKKVGEKYRCNVCGNEVTVTKVGGGTLVCCGQEMELISSSGFSGSEQKCKENKPKR